MPSGSIPKFLSLLIAVTGLSLCPVYAHADPLPSVTPTTSSLDLDAGAGAESARQPIHEKSKTPAGVFITLFLMLSFIAGAFFIGKRHETSAPYFSAWTLPFSTRLVFTLLIGVYAAAHAMAATTVYLDTRVTYASAQEYFFYLKPARLTALSHAHLMGITTMEGLVAILYTMTNRSSGFSVALVILVFVGIVGDLGSWWAIKYLSPSYELVSMVNGIFFSVGFLIMAISIIRELWRRSPRLKGVT